VLPLTLGRQQVWTLPFFRREEKDRFSPLGVFLRSKPFPLGVGESKYPIALFPSGAEEGGFLCPRGRSESPSTSIEKSECPSPPSPRAEVTRPHILARSGAALTTVSFFSLFSSLWQDRQRSFPFSRRGGTPSRVSLLEIFPPLLLHARRRSGPLREDFPPLGEVRSAGRRQDDHLSPES